MSNKDTFESIQFRKAFGNIIKAARKRQNLFQQNICDQVGITQAYYSSIETGKREIGLVLANKICEALNVGFDDFMKYFEDSANQPQDESLTLEQELAVVKEVDLQKNLSFQKPDRMACSIYLSTEANEKLERLAKQYGCGKGRVLEALLQDIP